MRYKPNTDLDHGAPSRGGYKLTGGSENASDRPLVSIVTVVFNRPHPLATTIESIRNQTYTNIEHIIIDAGSTDATLDTIRRYEDSIAFWQSEPDDGIYDGINKGIQRSSGDFIMLLHAADTYDNDYVDRLVSAAEQNPGAIIYSGHRHGAVAVDTGDFDEGIFLHHLGINHLTFLVPATVYAQLGGYDTKMRVMSDVVWMGHAALKGIKFVRVDGHGLNFAEGGLSSAATPTQRQMVIAEAVTFYRTFFPFMPEDIASTIYLYRFNEDGVNQILRYVNAVLSCPDRPEKVELFLKALRSALRYIWSKRSVDAVEMPSNFNARWELATRLGIELDHVNLRNSVTELRSIVQLIDALKRAIGSKKVTVHYLEVFSRPSETFVPDFINRLRRHTDEEHVILCDRRVLADKRAYPHIFAFDYSKFSPEFGRRVTELFLDTLQPSSLIFHFATNGWRLLSRIGPRYHELPAIFMTHGIDVFDLYKPSPCTDFILKVAAKLPNVRFTAVSSYLRDALVDAGVPFSKVTLIHNVPHDRFAQHRVAGAHKVDDLRQTKYAARLINIGRIVRWKGQADIVRAMALLRRSGIDVHLTLVYGQETDDLDNLRQIIANEGMSGRVALHPFVDFNSQPDFFTNFDILVSASKYTKGPGARSETFGMSIIEAIAAGLPVVVTDAGGQPEVAGPPNDYVRIARHNNPESLADEIRTLIESGALAGDNSVVSEDRLHQFSEKRQMALFSTVSSETQARRLKPLLISTALNQGAGGAAQGVHRSLLAADVQSRLAFRHLLEGWRLIPAVRPVEGAVKYVTDNTHPTGWFLRQGHTIFSMDTDGIPLEELKELVKDVDVINLHWYARFLSNANIAWLTNCGKPVVFTIRDMHPLTGGCHFFHGCDNWKNACFPCPQFRPENIPLPRQEFERKRLGWNFDNISVVTLSDHTRRIVEESPLFRGCRMKTIPNPVDTTVFRPLPKQEARNMLGLPADRKVIAYLPSFDSTIKGGVEFEQMLRRLAHLTDKNDILVICAGRRKVEIDVPFDVIQIGYIRDRKQLAAFYSSADVTVTPSLEETFSNTVAESIACGTPVAGFATGAIPTLAREARGKAVTIGDVNALADATHSILSRAHENDPDALHTYIVQHHSPEGIGVAYKDFFSELVATPPIVKQSAPLQEESTLHHYLAVRLAHAERLGNASVSHFAPTGGSGTVPNTLNIQLPGRVQAELRQSFKTSDGVLVGDDDILIPASSNAGHRLFGPNVPLANGLYRINVSMTVDFRERMKRKFPKSRCVVEIVWNVNTILASKTFSLERFSPGEFAWNQDFEITAEDVLKFKEGFEVRVWTDGLVAWKIAKTTLLEKQAISKIAF